MITLLYIIIATFLVSLCGLIGIFTFSINERKLSMMLMHLVSLAAGALMGGAFIHLLPESSTQLDSGTMFTMVLLSFVLFFLIEKLLHWHHCHKGNTDTHTFGYMSLVGDSVHNFIDGLIIAATFMTDIRLGIVTALGVILHEIPQEIGDFAVLLYSGFSKQKAVLSNFLVAIIAILGGIAGYFLSVSMHHFMTYIIPFAAGGFIYISASDLMPEIRKEQSLKKTLISFGFFLLGIAIMYAVKLLGIE